jgi:5-methylcytosine-specific restriction endonuclease McrBC GTP-binding regulatory subunit McrB
MPKHRSLIWAIASEQLVELVKESCTLTEILNKFHILNKGHNYRTLKKRLDNDVIDYSHIKLGLNSNIGRVFKREKIPLEKILIEHSTFNRNHLKVRLLKEGLLKNQCYECRQLPTWNGKPLSLQLDHINGVSDDNRIFNLRILCPHCHSQTENFAGKNKHRQSKI